MRIMLTGVLGFLLLGGSAIAQPSYDYAPKHDTQSPPKPISSSITDSDTAFCDTGSCDFGCCDYCPGNYFSFYSGWVDLNNDLGNTQLFFNDGWLLGGAMGTHLTNRLRFELDGTWRNNTSSRFAGGLGGHLNNYAMMANILADYPLSQKFNIYGGLGLGAAYQDGNFTNGTANFGIDDWAFAYQGIAGLDYRLTRCSKLFVEYRYYGNSSTDIENAAGMPVDSMTYDSNNLILGLRFFR